MFGKVPRVKVVGFRITVVSGVPGHPTSGTLGTRVERRERGNSRYKVGVTCTSMSSRAEATKTGRQRETTLTGRIR